MASGLLALSVVVPNFTTDGMGNLMIFRNKILPRKLASVITIEAI